jgi:hypothetical protein
MINNSKNILLVDVSYTVFYKFFALRNWYKRAHPDKEIPDDYDWLQDKVFMDKYRKLFFDKILKLCRKNNISFSNIVFNIDCKHTTIWRSNIFSAYKATRGESHRRSKFNAFGLFKIVIDELLPEFKNKYNSSIFKVLECEADDIIAHITLFLDNNELDNNTFEDNETRKIFILASDTDYIQLCNHSVILIDMNGNYLNQKYLINSVNNTSYLIQKILIGDVSDNIPQCHICSEYLKKFNIPYQEKLTKKETINGDTVVYVKCNKLLVEKMLKNMEMFLYFSSMLKKNRKDKHIINNKQELEKIDNQISDNQISDNHISDNQISDNQTLDNQEFNYNIIMNQQFNLNQLLIDFKKLPINYSNTIISMLKSELN